VISAPKKVIHTKRNLANSSDQDNELESTYLQKTCAATTMTIKIIIEMVVNSDTLLIADLILLR
jgi:hypothetical protein